MSNFLTDFTLTSIDKHQGHILVQELHTLHVLVSLHALSSGSTALGNNVASRTAGQYKRT
jgi:hypothetical protein